MGHASIETTKRYILLDNKRKRKSVNDDTIAKVLQKV